MSTLRTIFWPAIMIASLVMFVSAHALAADAALPIAPDGQNVAMLIPMLGVAVASILAYVLRYLSAKYDFFHNGVGKAIITVVGTTITTLTPYVQSGKFSWFLLAWAGVGAISSFAATLSPSLVALNNSKE
jgi:hypothetical protein